MRIVDAHHHLWDLAVRDQAWTADLPALRRSFHLSDLEPLAAAAGVTATVLVQTIHAVDETPEMLALAETSDLVAGVVGWTDVTEPNFGERLAELLSGVGGRRLVGIRHQVQELPDGGWLTGTETLRGLRQLAPTGLAFDLIVRADQLPACVAAARAVPELSFVLDHLGKPPIAAGELEPWASDIRTLAESPNVSCKLSGMVTEADPERWKVADLRPYAEVVLEAFGPERVMFGSDWPVSTLAADYAQIVDTAKELTAGLSEAEREAVFGGTAIKVYGLE
ncbi:amidohydrolase family protein [Catenulispora pinisilvae]|uniref:amidohydrolase family protein n=1 Tax=Catenulispora pinisilvae TaxID=2705253 RepID=UPI001891D157|nr:amidohydrolase family protein [Catenulispora pinisilvae]